MQIQRFHGNSSKTGIYFNLENKPNGIYVTPITQDFKQSYLVEDKDWKWIKTGEQGGVQITTSHGAINKHGEEYYIEFNFPVKMKKIDITHVPNQVLDVDAFGYWDEHGIWCPNFRKDFPK